MKQKIVINVPMHNDKAKSKAMKIAMAIPGVTSVSLGAESDQLEVTGEGVDSVCLANSGKKFCFANIMNLEDVKPASAGSGGSPSPGSSPSSSPPKQYYPPPPYWPPVYYERRVYDDPPNCSIM